MRVLIIEDDPSVGAAIELLLGREGYETVHSLDAAIGMIAFESFSFDLAIIDIFLPDINGLGAIAEFHRRAPRMPILAMSGFIFRDSMNLGLDYLAMAIQAGAAVRLRKPFAPRQLIEAVNSSLASVVPVPAL